MGQLNKELSTDQREALINTLQLRFEKNISRHSGIVWDEVLQRLDNKPTAFWSLHEMERTGGEPDVVGRDPDTQEVLFYDCSPESPPGRRSCCYDREGLESRKENRPEHNAIDLAIHMGIQILSEEEYRFLQSLGTFDLKTSSWILTPAPIRKLGGALFCDRRYDHVFVYHNGAQSYYAARGFRGVLRL